MKTSPWVIGLGATFVLAGVTAAQSGKSIEARWLPADIAKLPTLGGGTGTSGVSGIRTTVLYGDPNVAGLYTIALQVPPNTHIASHKHRDERTATVISGTWNFGYGEHASETVEKALGPGSFYTEPANLAHFARTGGTTAVVYITGFGPSDTHYVEAATVSKGH